MPFLFGEGYKLCLIRYKQLLYNAIRMAHKINYQQNAFLCCSVRKKYYLCSRKFVTKFI